jgi:A/G-specific adenine glycosylase
MKTDHSYPQHLAADLLAWWDHHGRKDLPWQRDPTPWRVWVSEIMLQQTQVATVTRYYDRFLAAFPEVVALADAADDAVLHLWSGLGYYARARNLHRAAQVVRDQHGGVVPTDFAALAALPGIGRSTAGAILALSQNQRHPILDGNVKRVLARVFRVEGYPGDSGVARQLWALAEACTPQQRAAHYTQAIMDLGASLCARARPACGLCPLAAGCEARVAGIAAQLPARKPARARPRRSTVLVLARLPDGVVLLERRPPTGVWGGLWGFPETTDVAAVANWCRDALGIEPATTRVRPVLQHAFSHFDLDMTPVEAELAAPPPRAMEPGRFLWCDPRAPAAVGLAAPVTRLLAALAEPGMPYTPDPAAPPLA